MIRIRTIALALIAGALLAGCAAAPARHQETAAQKADRKADQKEYKAKLLAASYRQQYLADVTPENNAWDSVYSARTNKQNRRAYSRLAAVDQSTAAKMLRQQWPASAKADIIAFATSLSVESGAEYAVAGDFKFDTYAHSTRKEVYWSGNDASMEPDQQRENTDSDASTAQAQKCRADLGLPPVGG